MKQITSYNESQQLAITSSDGFILIIAGAGSGKTTVITHRIAYLIQEKFIDPSQILGLTFTNKAAGEMQDRLARIINKKIASQVMLCTFHRFCMYVLRREIHHLGYTKEFSLYDESDVKRLLKTIAKQYLKIDDLTPFTAQLEEILQAKQLGRRPEDIKDPETKEMFTYLEMSMRAYNAVDFDTLLSLTVDLFIHHPQVLEKYQNQFRYIMIDEYQDTNATQNTLSHLLARKNKNLCVVGDDDQAIYSWRGSDIKNILSFPATSKVTLEKNYRSTPNILEVANHVIQHNRNRHVKWLQSHKAFGDPVHIFNASNDLEEAQGIIDRILYLKENKNLPWKDIAILYRSNILARPFELALLGTLWRDGNNWKRGIPYEIIGGTELYARAEVKDLIAYLRVIINPNDQESLLRIINYPRRGISAKTLDILTQINRSENRSLWNVLLQVRENRLSVRLTTMAMRGINIFLNLIEELKKIMTAQGIYAAITHLIQTLNLKSHIEEEVKSQKAKTHKWDNVREFMAMIQSFEQQADDKGSCSEFLQSLTLQQNPTTSRDLSNNSVKLLTFHSSKGLEFPACFVVALEDHLVPHAKSLSTGSVEEERRLFYVALTRAQKYLTLSMSRTRNKRGKEDPTNPSRFLYEIPKDCLQITASKTITPFDF